MTEEQLKQFLEDNKESIQETVKQKAISSLLEQHRWNISDQINKVVNEFVTKEIIPAVTEELQSHKGVIIQAAIGGIAMIGEDLSKALITQASKNIQDSWRSKEITKAIFGY